MICRFIPFEPFSFSIMLSDKEVHQIPLFAYVAATLLFENVNPVAGGCRLINKVKFPV